MVRNLKGRHIFQARPSPTCTHTCRYICYNCPKLCKHLLTAKNSIAHLTSISHICLSYLYSNVHLHLRNGDILQGSFAEDYYKLAYKSMCAFGWSQANCPSVPWFLKTDDDTFISMHSLNNHVLQMEAHNSRWKICL